MKSNFICSLVAVLAAAVSLSAGAACPHYEDKLLQKVMTGYETSDLNAVTEGTPIMAKFMRGTKPEHFAYPTDDASRRVVFFMDNSGVAELVNRELKSQLWEIGYETEYIDYLYIMQTQFKMIFFHRDERFLLATWDNLAIVLKQAYPGKEFAALMDQYLPELKRMSFADIEATAPKRLYELNKFEKTDRLYITSDKLNASTKLWQFRAFIYNEVRVTELYTGTGVTLNPNTGKGIPEYVAAVGTLPIEQIGQYVIRDLKY